MVTVLPIPQLLVLLFEFEDVKSLWEAGAQLFARSPGDRVIYTTAGGTDRMPFSAAYAETLQTLLQAEDVNEATAIIRYIRGEDTPFNPPIEGFSPAYRNRTVTILRHNKYAEIR
jgi:hypothetical protein